MNKLKREYQFFKQQTLNVRVLLMTNLLYAFVLPVVEIFVGAYVMRHTSEPVSVAFYQLFMYIGIIATSFVNGFLLRHVAAARQSGTRCHAGWACRYNDRSSHFSP